MSNTDLMVEDWGLISYQDALSRQLQKVSVMGDAICVASSPCSLSEHETLIVCSHPPVVTLGRGTKPGDVFGWQGETAEISRGGRATYHGPSQLVVYPILNLNKRRPSMPVRDLHAYMRVLEDVIIETLREFGVEAGTYMYTREQCAETKVVETQCTQYFAAAEAKEPSFTGVWVNVARPNDEGFETKKIASIGIGVKKWISFHGLALNVDYDAKAHTGINPCGFQTQTMTSMEEVLGRPVDKNSVAKVLIAQLQRRVQI